MECDTKLVINKPESIASVVSRILAYIVKYDSKH